MELIEVKKLFNEDKEKKENEKKENEKEKKEKR